MSSPVSLPIEIYRSAERGELQKVVKWVRKGGPVDALFPSASTHDGRVSSVTLLHAASGEGQLEMVRMLLKRGARVNLQTRLGCTALMGAAYNGHLSVVLVLLQHSANPDLQETYGQSALMWAQGHESCVRALLRARANTELLDDDGRTALHWAAAGFDLQYGQSALMWAQGHESCVRALLRARANTELLDNDGRTALHWAESKGHTATAELIRQLTAPPQPSAAVASEAMQAAQAAQAARAARAAEAAQAAQAARAARAAQAARADAAMEELLAEEVAEQAKAQAPSKKSKKKKKKKADRAAAAGDEPSGAPSGDAPDPGNPIPDRPGWPTFQQKEELDELCTHLTLAELNQMIDLVRRTCVAAVKDCDGNTFDLEGKEVEIDLDALDMETFDKVTALVTSKVAAAAAVEAATAAEAEADALERAVAAGAGEGGSSGAAGPSEASEAVEVPHDYICPITSEIMNDPVTTVDGFTYERTAITEWLRTKDTSPSTGATLEITMLIPNLSLRSVIRSFVEASAAIPPPPPPAPP